MPDEITSVDWLNLALNTLELLLLVGLIFVGRQQMRRSDALRARQMEEQVTQTQLLQRLVTRVEQAFGPTIAANRYQQIVDALLKSGAYDTPAARDNLTLSLPDRLRESLARQDNARGDLIGIITRAARWSDSCLNDLIDAALYEIRGSAAEKDLLRLRAEVRASQLDAGGEIH